jgi:hypothetical protein
MAGGMVVALPLYYWRLHNTEVTQEDFVDLTPMVGGESENNGMFPGEKPVRSTTVDEKALQ